MPATTVIVFSSHLDAAVNRPAEVLEDPTPKLVVSLGAPATLQCYAYGFPNPSVTWWKEEKLLPMLTDLYEQRRDHSLVVKHVTLHLLGPYTCQAYNGHGGAASWTTTLQAVGTVLTLSPDDEPYIIYLLPVPQVPPYTDPSYTQLPPPVTAVTPIQERPPLLRVPAQANIVTNQTTYVSGSDIELGCSVDGNPPLRVTWYKNGAELEPSTKLSINESTLFIRNADSNDTGEYRCNVMNDYSSSYSAITLTVEGAYVHPNCSDNPLFANCKLIVQAQYCKHEYYGKFCCRSCTLAGQLPPYGEELLNYYASNGGARGSSDTISEPPPYEGRRRRRRHVRHLVT